MRVVCTDGTIFECRSYEVVSAGVVLFGDRVAEGAHRYAPDREQIGFVPHAELRYILPDGVEPRPAPDAPRARAPGAPPGPGRGGGQQRGRQPRPRPQAGGPRPGE